MQKIWLPNSCTFPGQRPSYPGYPGYVLQNYDRNFDVSIMNWDSKKNVNRFGWVQRCGFSLNFNQQPIALKMFLVNLNIDTLFVDNDAFSVEISMSKAQIWIKFGRLTT